MEICSGHGLRGSHDEICFESGICPVCHAQQELESSQKELESSQTDCEKLEDQLISTEVELQELKDIISTCDRCQASLVIKKL